MVDNTLIRIMVKDLSCLTRKYLVVADAYTLHTDVISTGLILTLIKAVKAKVHGL